VAAHRRYRLTQYLRAQFAEAVLLHAQRDDQNPARIQFFTTRSASYRMPSAGSIRRACWLVIRGRIEVHAR
jgi:hypothetical protein